MAPEGHMRCRSIFPNHNNPPHQRLVSIDRIYYRVANLLPPVGSRAWVSYLTQIYLLWASICPEEMWRQCLVVQMSQCWGCYQDWTMLYWLWCMGPASQQPLKAVGQVHAGIQHLVSAWNTQAVLQRVCAASSELQHLVVQVWLVLAHQRLQLRSKHQQGWNGSDVSLQMQWWLSGASLQWKCSVQKTLQWW